MYIAYKLLTNVPEKGLFSYNLSLDDIDEIGRYGKCSRNSVIKYSIRDWCKPIYKKSKLFVCDTAQNCVRIAGGASLLNHISYNLEVWEVVCDVLEEPIGLSKCPNTDRIKHIWDDLAGSKPIGPNNSMYTGTKLCNKLKLLQKIK